MSVGTDFDAVRLVLIDCLEGMIYGDGNRLSRAFHPAAVAAGHYKGVYHVSQRDDFIESWKRMDTETPGTP